MSPPKAYVIINHMGISKLEKFFSQYKRLSFHKGVLILTASEPILHVYYLKKGAVRIYALSDEGEEVTLHIAQAGAYFPMMLVLAGKKNQYYYEATTNTEIFSAPVKDTIKFIKNDQELLFELTSRFASGLCGMMIRVEKLVSDTSYIKTASLLAYLADKFGHKMDRGLLIQLQFTHTNISSWLGINRETASRQMKKLEKKGLIDYQEGLIIVKDMERLQKESL